MSDNGLTTDAVPAAVTSAPPPAVPAVPPASAGAADVLAEPPADQAVFPRSYVEDLRREAARYRDEARVAQTNVQTYEDVFGVYPQEDRDVWFGLARQWAADPNRAAQVMQEIASNVLGTDNPTPTEVEAVAEEMEAAGLTAESVEQMIASKLNEREQARAQQEAINGVFAEVRAAGYDPETGPGFMVLYNANHFTNGDIPKAIEMVKAYDQTVIDNYVAGRSGHRPTPSPAGGVLATSAGEPITSIDDARKATEAFLRERSAAS